MIHELFTFKKIKSIILIWNKISATQKKVSGMIFISINLFEVKSIYLIYNEW